MKDPVIARRRATIAHLLPWPTIGGVEIATIRLIAATRDEFRHVAFCISGTGELQEACRQAGAETVTYAPPDPSIRHGLRFLKQSRAVADALIQTGAQLAHCAETKAAYHNSLAVRMAKVPLLSHVRSRYSELGLRDRLTLLPVDRFIFVSEASRREFAVKVPDSKARVLYDAVTFSEPAQDAELVREEFGLPADCPLIGMVARVNPQKDYDTLLDAVVLVLAKRPEARFMVVGDNLQVALNREHYQRVLAKVRLLGLEDRIVFTGFQPDVPRFVSAFDVFVLCTHREGLPLSILEAMGTGKPVIATAVDGIPEVITDRVTGLLHSHQNSVQLAALILECLGDPSFARRLGEAAREQTRRLYDVATFASNVTRIYEESLRPASGIGN